MSVIFVIHEEGNGDFDDYVYTLKWWNQKERYETNAIAVQIQPKDIKQTAETICFMRMKKFAQKSELEWKWYDNDTSEYKLMGAYTDEKTGELVIDGTLIDTLEASFLGNKRDNFDPVQIGVDFNLCWLPEIYAFLDAKLNIRGSNDYLFSVTFRDTEDNDVRKIIENIEQIGYTHSEGNAFPRNIARFIDGRNSLHMGKAENKQFIHRWMRMYQLFTKQQQCYFWSFILSIATQIKCIDIEFEHQLVLLPLTKAYRNKKESQSIITELIDHQDIEDEQNDAVCFEGSFIPPLQVWQQIIKKDANRKVSKCGILRMHETKENIWLMDKNDYEKFQYDKDRAILLRMLDCVRKFILEFEEKHTVHILWPWFQNSMFSKNSCFRQNYNALMQKYNLVQEYDVEKLWKLLPKTQIEQDMSNENTQDSIQYSSIRHKRKWAAMMLLNNQIERNLNYIKHFLNEQLDELIDAACPKDDPKHGSDFNEQKKK